MKVQSLNSSSSVRCGFLPKCPVKKKCVSCQPSSTWLPLSTPYLFREQGEISVKGASWCTPALPKLKDCVDIEGGAPIGSQSLDLCARRARDQTEPIFLCELPTHVHLEGVTVRVENDLGGIDGGLVAYRTIVLIIPFA